MNLIILNKFIKWNVYLIGVVSLVKFGEIF